MDDLASTKQVCSVCFRFRATNEDARKLNPDCRKHFKCENCETLCYEINDDNCAISKGGWNNLLSNTRMERDMWKRKYVAALEVIEAVRKLLSGDHPGSLYSVQTAVIVFDSVNKEIKE